MKRLIACIVALSLAVLPLAACSNTQSQASEDKISVVCTNFPQYDWAKEILGDSNDQIDLTLLLDSGVDLHSFQPTAEDIATISGCDLFIYVGGESDAWAEDVLKTANNDDMVVVNMMDVLGNTAKQEEIKEGMEHDEDAEHAEHDEDSHDHDAEDESHSHETDLDEHVWLSLRNAEVLSQHIADAISGLDPDNASTYQANAEAYHDQLSLLDENYQELVDAATYHTLLFGDRFPFRYLVDDYGIDYYAAFPGCSSETAASFETVIKLAGIVDEKNLETVMVTESSDEALAKTIIENTKTKDQQILVMDSMQSVTAHDISSGTTYLSLATDNLEVLKEALN